MTIDDKAVASDSNYYANHVLLQVDQPVEISRGDNIQFAIECDISASAQAGNYYLSFEDSNSFTFSDKNLSTNVSPLLSGGEFPLRSSEMSITGASLAASFTNYPNPFDPATDGWTRIAFVLTEAAIVDLDIYSITGDHVKQLLAGASLASGDHNDIKWTANNDAGRDVLPGTYFCQIRVIYSSGETETLRRKVAVTR